MRPRGALNNCKTHHHKASCSGPAPSAVLQRLGTSTPCNLLLDRCMQVACKGRHRSAHPTSDLHRRLSDIQEFKKPLMFIATMDNQPVLVKFVQRYGADVHRSWAAAGLAPKLLSFDALPDGWHMAVMERLPEAQWTCLRCLVTALKPAARKAALGGCTPHASRVVS